MKSRLVRIECKDGKRKEADLAVKGTRRDPCADGNILYLDYINVSVLAAVL